MINRNKSLFGILLGALVGYWLASDKQSRSKDWLAVQNAWSKWLAKFRNNF
jgi:hypothetical protein